jgi:hypothetical protein
MISLFLFIDVILLFKFLAVVNFNETQNKFA